MIPSQGLGPFVDGFIISFVKWLRFGNQQFGISLRLPDEALQLPYLPTQKFKMKKNYWFRQLLGNIELGYTTEVKYFNQPYHEGNGFSEKGALGDGTSITKYDGHLTSIEEAKSITKIHRTGEIAILSLRAVSIFNEIKFSKKGEFTRYSPNRVTSLPIMKGWKVTM